MIRSYELVKNLNIGNNSPGKSTPGKMILVKIPPVKMPLPFFTLTLCNRGNIYRAPKNSSTCIIVGGEN